MILTCLLAGMNVAAQSPPHALLVELAPRGALRLNGRPTLWPQAPVHLLHAFHTTSVRRITARVEPGLTAWELGDSMRTLRRFASAAACAAPAGHGRPLVHAVVDRQTLLPEQVPLYRWLVSRFLRPR